MYDELVKRLRDAAKMSEALAVLLPHSEGNATAKLYKGAADAIEELTALSRRQEVELVELTGELASKPRWIPVTERLPKADEYDERGYAVPYLVMNGWMRVTARRTKDYWVLFGNGTVLEYVTYWMPLPEPQKEET